MSTAIITGASRGFGHALTAGGDLHTGWGAAIVWGSAAAMTIAVSVRLAVAAWTRRTARTRRAPGALPGARRELHGARQ